jgi:hypothetical protein
MHDTDERKLIKQVRRLQRNPIEQVLDTPEVRRTRSTNNADNVVALLEQKFGEIRAVLARDAGDQRAFWHWFAIAELNCR